jgi:CheY-like chemotaxis protein
MNRVLIIDNSETDAFMLSQLLQVMGHSTEVVTSMSAASARLGDYSPHFVICSQSLPETDRSFLAANYRTARGAPFILVALSDGAAAQSADSSTPPGFDHQLVKPIDILQLQELMDDYLGDGQSNGRAPG